MAVTVKDIYDSVERFTSGHAHSLSNVFIHGWEADHFSVTSSVYSYEFEVKVSRSDYFADFSKFKHGIFKNYKKGAFVYSTPGRWIKQYLRENGIEYYAESEGINSGFHNGDNCPNRFFYAVPTGLVSVDEVPEYAGLMYVERDLLPNIVKKAPLLHKGQFPIQAKLFSKYYWGYLNLRLENRKLQRELEKLKEGENPNQAIK